MYAHPRRQAVLFTIFIIGVGSHHSPTDLNVLASIHLADVENKREHRGVVQTYKCSCMFIYIVYDTHHVNRNDIMYNRTV